jgi:hypothetical protein
MFLVVDYYDSSEGHKPLLATEEILVSRDHEQMQSNSQMSYQLDIERNGSLDVSIVEIYGNNIDFKIMKEGKQKYYSGVKTGKVTGKINVSKGRYYLIVMNDNILESKVVDITAKLLP